VVSKVCEMCGEAMVPYHGYDRFCSRVCSDRWFQEERRQAVAYFRAQGMRPQLRNGDQQREEAQAR
jgi:hypothetical protein